MKKWLITVFQPHAPAPLQPSTHFLTMFVVHSNRRRRCREFDIFSIDWFTTRDYSSELTTRSSIEFSSSIHCRLSLLCLLRADRNRKLWVMIFGVVHETTTEENGLIGQAAEHRTHNKWMSRKCETFSVSHPVSPCQKVGSLLWQCSTTLDYQINLKLNAKLSRLGSHAREREKMIRWWARCDVCTVWDWGKAGDINVKDKCCELASEGRDWERKAAPHVCQL